MKMRPYPHITHARMHAVNFSFVLKVDELEKVVEDLQRDNQNLLHRCEELQKIVSVQDSSSEDSSGNYAKWLNHSTINKKLFPHSVLPLLFENNWLQRVVLLFIYDSLLTNKYNSTNQLWRLLGSKKEN